VEVQIKILRQILDLDLSLTVNSPRKRLLLLYKESFKILQDVKQMSNNSCSHNVDKAIKRRISLAIALTKVSQLQISKDASQVPKPRRAQ
jgi:hypothetical protein